MSGSTSRYYGDYLKPLEMQDFDEMIEFTNRLENITDENKDTLMSYLSQNLKRSL